MEKTIPQSSSSRTPGRAHFNSSFINRDFFYSYNTKKKLPRVTERQFSSILSGFNELMVERMLIEKRQKLPKVGTMGIYQMRAFDGGRVLIVDPKASLKERKVVYNLNHHSEGKAFRCIWLLSPALEGKYGRGYFFRKAKSVKQKMAAHFRAGNIDYPYYR